MQTAFYPITGGQDIITMNGEPWKHCRSVFNPGFQPSYLVSQVPGIVQEVMVYREILYERCREQKLFQLDPITLNLTMDVIARATL